MLCLFPSYSDGSNEEELETLAESELANLNLDSRDGYLAEVRAAEHGQRCCIASDQSVFMQQLLRQSGLSLYTHALGVVLQIGKMIAQPSKVSKFIGMDVTSLMSVPLFIMEPFSMLQKMAEIMEYTELLDEADKSEDQYERCASIASKVRLAITCMRPGRRLQAPRPTSSMHNPHTQPHSYH